MKHTRHSSSRKSIGGKRSPPRLYPHASRLLLAGYILILLSLCDFAARLSAGTSVEPLLYIEPYMRSVSSATILLWGAAIGLDWLERTQNRRDS
ncbi:MAG: hypothetical protein IJX72_07640 [Clostridia bacterium]|nr:hypothetical protein [Clostridia bacterium]